MKNILSQSHGAPLTALCLTCVESNRSIEAIELFDSSGFMTTKRSCKYLPRVSDIIPDSPATAGGCFFFRRLTPHSPAAGANSGYQI